MLKTNNSFGQHWLNLINLRMNQIDQLCSIASVEFEFDENIPSCYEKLSKSGFLNVIFLKSRIFVWEIFKIVFFSSPLNCDAGSQAKAGLPRRNRHGWIPWQRYKFVSVKTYTKDATAKNSSTISTKLQVRYYKNTVFSGPGWIFRFLCRF